MTSHQNPQNQTPDPKRASTPESSGSETSLIQKSESTDIAQQRETADRELAQKKEEADRVLGEKLVEKAKEVTAARKAATNKEW